MTAIPAITAIYPALPLPSHPKASQFGVGLSHPPPPDFFASSASFAVNGRARSMLLSIGVISVNQ